MVPCKRIKKWLEAPVFIAFLTLTTKLHCIIPVKIRLSFNGGLSRCKLSLMATVKVTSHFFKSEVCQNASGADLMKFGVKGASINSWMSLTMSYLKFRQGERTNPKGGCPVDIRVKRIASASVDSKDYSRSYMIEIQRSMNLKEPLSGGASRYDQAMNGVNRSPLYS